MISIAEYTPQNPYSNYYGPYVREFGILSLRSLGKGFKDSRERGFSEAHGLGFRV